MGSGVKKERHRAGTGYANAVIMNRRHLVPPLLLLILAQLGSVLPGCAPGEGSRPGAGGSGSGSGAQDPGGGTAGTGTGGGATGGAAIGGEGGLGGGGSTVEPKCFVSTTTDVPDCSEFQLCLTTMPKISVSPDTCGSEQCAWLFDTNAGDTLTYENEEGWVFLRFSSLAGVETTEELRAAFEHINFYAKFPLTDETKGDATYFEQWGDPDELDEFSLVDGRLHVKVAFHVTEPYASVLSQTRICGDTNLCLCRFADVSGSSAFDIDLPMQLP